ncbi:hypothetical protein [Vibrio parahaemolyticus]|uniref:hypothetical protein n=1 Tax=Vibrio parahaemolyticus TaxID=670 RepID=UPI00223EE11F|nr:hypothetical protein [Vibrio parahaemolyticus]MDL1993011.1 hypothetical protein [Vibrio parahaemolyticus]
MNIEAVRDRTFLIAKTFKGVEFKECLKPNENRLTELHFRHPMLNGGDWFNDYYVPDSLYETEARFAIEMNVDAQVYDLNKFDCEVVYMSEEGWAFITEIEDKERLLDDSPLTESIDAINNEKISGTDLWAYQEHYRKLDRFLVAISTDLTVFPEINQPDTQ